ncbi:MAG: helix-turn-helix transcriptional regulator [Clostridia bacterium]|nr:helix-turn-helix transcriptional regulator [Clostridia bacterium]
MSLEWSFLLEYCDTFSEVAQFPIYFINNKKLLYIAHAGEDFAPVAKALAQAQNETTARFAMQNGLLMEYYLPLEDGTLLLGPVAIMPADNDTLMGALEQAGLLIQGEEFREFADRFRRHRTMTMNAFWVAVDCVCLALTGQRADWGAEQLPTEPILSDRQDEPLTEETEVEWARYNRAYVEQMQYIIRNGLVRDLEELIASEHPAPYGDMAFDTLRHYKNSMMVHIYIVRCAACEGGLSEELAVRLSEHYSQRCEVAASIEELIRISQQLRMDFCKRVQHLQKVPSRDLNVGKAMRYIDSHYMEPLTAKQVAEAIGVSYSYLCSHFKAEAGMSIVEYNQRAKVQNARRLLEMSDYSLGEIASYLSFSSQSYFQTIFKKIEGVTPKQYRENTFRESH